MDKQPNKTKCLFVGGVGFCLLIIIAFLSGITLQNLLFPTARTAAAGWLIFFMPMLGLPALLIGAWMGYLIRKGEQYAQRARYFTYVMIIGLLVAIGISWGFWLVTVFVLIAAYLNWLLVLRFGGVRL